MRFHNYTTTLEPSLFDLPKEARFQKSAVCGIVLTEVPKMDKLQQHASRLSKRLRETNKRLRETEKEKKESEIAFRQAEKAYRQQIAELEEQLPLAKRKCL